MPTLYFKNGSTWTEFPTSKTPTLLWSGTLYASKSTVQTITVSGITNWNTLIVVGIDDTNDCYVSIPMVRVPDGAPMYNTATNLNGFNHRWSGMGTLYDKRQYQYQGGYGFYIGALAANDSDQVRGAIPYGAGTSADASAALNWFMKGTSANAVPLNNWNSDPWHPEDMNDRAPDLLRIYGIN